MLYGMRKGGVFHSVAKGQMVYNGSAVGKKSEDISEKGRNNIVI